MSPKPHSDDICFDDAPVVHNHWTAEDEADWQLVKDSIDAAYEELVSGRYAARGQANLY